MKSQEAIQTAQRLAAASRNPEITPAHLLVALLEQEDGLVPAVLNKLGADLPSTKSRARQAMADLPTLGEGANADPRPSSAFTEVLRRAEGEMAQMGDEYLSTEHMLLAISDVKSPLADLLPARARMATPNAAPNSTCSRSNSRAGCTSRGTASFPKSRVQARRSS